MIGLPARRTAAAKCRSAGLSPARASTTNRIASQSASAASVCARIRPASVSGSPSARPAVSMIVNARSAILASPSRRSRVTPGSSSTSASLRPTSRLNSVDLPTFGRPMIATLALMSFQPAGPARPASKLLRRRSVRGHQSEPAARQLPLVLRDFEIAEHLIELLGRIVIVLARERERGEIEPREAPERPVPARKRGQLRRALLLLAGDVGPDQRRAQSRGVAEERGIAESPATASKAAAAPCGSLCALTPAAVICASAR